MCSGFVGTKKPVQEVITTGLYARELDREGAVKKQGRKQGRYIVTGRLWKWDTRWQIWQDFLV
jgi:hypothetical protein